MNALDLILLTPIEMGQADKAAVSSGVGSAELMENAGRAVASAVRSRWSLRPVTVLCGPGNNGGDGFVAARHLHEWGWPVKVALLGPVDRLTGDAAHFAARWQGVVEPLSLASLDGAGLVVDALFGAGLSRPLEGEAATVVQGLAARNIPVCAVDVPSGLDGRSGEARGPVAAADVTVTFFRKKPGHLLLPGRLLCGDLIVADIGIPATVLHQIGAKTHENGPGLWLDVYPWPQADAHKYRRGHVLVVGGAVMTGAARLSALGAARIGAGLVTIAAPAAAWGVYASALTSIMVQPFDDADRLVGILDDARKNAIVIGPGAGVSDATRQHAAQALATRRNVVLDADAITSFTADPHALFAAIGGPCVLTPHEGEFSRIFSARGDKLERARAAARQSNAVVVIKGADTVIAAPDGRAVVNANAPADLATGGTGDVLAGFIAGLMAQGLKPFRAAAAAVWLHGEAARLSGPGLISEDLPEALRPALRALKDQALHLAHYV